MRFGVLLGADPTTVAREVRLLEERGFDTAWFPEAPLVGYGDPYVSMALAGQVTERIRFGTLVTPAGVRPAPLLLTQFGTAARVAPRRVRLGWGSGAFSRGLVGLPPLKVRDLREELTVLRGLLDRGRAELKGTTMRFADWERPSVDLDEISLEVAAAGPRTAALAGELGDGLITGGEIRPAEIAALRDAALGGAAEAGRPVTSFSVTVEMPAMCVLRDGETLESPRVVETLQPVLSSYLSGWIRSGGDPEKLPPEVRDSYVRFRDWVFAKYGDDPAVVRDRLVDRWIGRNPEHDPFITADLVRSRTLTGTLDEICGRLRDIASAGATDIAFTPPVHRELADGDVLADLVTIAEAVG